MKKTQFIDFISTIKNTAVSFIAISVFIALGLAFYGGTAWSVDHAENSFTETYQYGCMRALLVTDSLGLTDDQVNMLKNIDGIDDAEGLNIVYRFLENKSGEKQQAAVVQITENIDKLINVEGNLPTDVGQTAVLRSWAEENNIAIGDVISFQNENGADYREMQSVRSIAQWDGEKIDDLTLSTDDPGYLKSSNLVVTALVDSSVYLSTNPYAHGICSANGLYIDAVLFVSKQEMSPETFGGYTSVVLYSNDLNNLNCFSDEYKSRSQTLSDSVQSIVDEWDRQLIEDFSCSVDKLRSQLDLLSAQTGIPLADGENLYELLDDMRQALSAQDCYTSVMENDTNNSFLTAENLIGVLKSIRSVLGITFMAIGVLICYSVISRLVADGAVQIGTRKALGFTRSEILRLYLCYVGSAMLIGGILGIFIGIFGIEYAFNNVLAEQFTFTRIPLVFIPMDILPVFLIVCIIIFTVTVEACHAENKKSPILLLLGGGKDTGNYDFVQKSIFFQKLSLLNKTVVLNLFKDKRRVFAMLTGIAGTAALIVAGLTLYLNFTNAFSKQFEDYYCFDYQIRYDASSDTASDEIIRILDSYNLSYAEVYSSCFIMHTPDGKTNAPNVIVPLDTQELSKLMHFDTENEKSVSYDNGVWMSNYYLYAYDAPVGSLLNLQTLDGKEAGIPIDNYYKHHLSTPVIVMDSESYRSAFGENASPNTFYVVSDGFDMNKLSEELDGIDGYIYTNNFYNSFLASFSSEEAVMLAFAALFTLMAVLMALMTIINLLNVYVEEKKNELIIMMINGYDRKFAKRYIYYDTAAITLIGIVIGLIAGSILGDRTLTAIEGTSIRMIHGISYLSCAISATVTAVLTAIICIHTLRKIDSFSLSDIDINK